MSWKQFVLDTALMQFEFAISSIQMKIIHAIEFIIRFDVILLNNADCYCRLLIQFITAR